MNIFLSENTDENLFCETTLHFEQKFIMYDYKVDTRLTALMLNLEYKSLKYSINTYFCITIIIILMYFNGIFEK